MLCLYVGQEHPNLLQPKLKVLPLMIYSKQTRILSASALVFNYGASQAKVIEVRGDELWSMSILNLSTKNQGLKAADSLENKHEIYRPLHW